MDLSWSSTTTTHSAHCSSSQYITRSTHRIRDQLTSKTRELNHAQTEITTLRSKLAAATKAIEALSRDRDSNKERCTKLAADVAAAQRQLTLARKDVQHLQREVASANLAADKAAAKLANAPKGPSFSDQVASLQAALKTVKADNHQLTTSLKALESSLRAKDKEIVRLNERESWAKSVEARSKALENEALEHKRQAEARASDIAQLQRLLRQRDADAVAMQQRLEASECDLQERSDRLAATRAELAMSQSMVGELQTEVSVLRNEAARVGAVAQRVAASEIRAGTKDCGMVPVAQHLAEITSLTEEVARLREQLVCHEASVRAAEAKVVQDAVQEVAEEQIMVEEQPAPRRSRRNRK